MKNPDCINIRARNRFFGDRLRFLKMKTTTLTFGLWVISLVFLLLFHSTEVSAIKCPFTFTPATLIEVVDG